MLLSCYCFNYDVGLLPVWRLLPVRLSCWRCLKRFPDSESSSPLFWNSFSHTSIPYSQLYYRTQCRPYWHRSLLPTFSAPFQTVEAAPRHKKPHIFQTICNLWHHKRCHHFAVQPSDVEPVDMASLFTHFQQNIQFTRYGPDSAHPLVHLLTLMQPHLTKHKTVVPLLIDFHAWDSLILLHRCHHRARITTSFEQNNKTTVLSSVTELWGNVGKRILDFSRYLGHKNWSIYYKQFVYIHFYSTCSSTERPSIATSAE